MAGTTESVRRALAELGPDAPDAEVKAYMRDKCPGIPESYVAMTLRKLRGRVIPARKDQPRNKPRGT